MATAGTDLISEDGVDQVDAGGTDLVAAAALACCVYQLYTCPEPGTATTKYVSAAIWSPGAYVTDDGGTTTYHIPATAVAVLRCPEMNVVTVTAATEEDCNGPEEFDCCKTGFTSSIGTCCFSTNSRVVVSYDWYDDNTDELWTHYETDCGCDYGGSVSVYCGCNAESTHVSGLEVPFYECGDNPNGSKFARFRKVVREWYCDDLLHRFVVEATYGEQGIPAQWKLNAFIETEQCWEEEICYWDEELEQEVCTGVFETYCETTILCNMAGPEYREGDCCGATTVPFTAGAADVRCCSPNIAPFYVVYTQFEVQGNQCCQDSGGTCLETATANCSGQCE